MPLWRRQSSGAQNTASTAAEANAREQARAAAIERRELYLQIRAYIPSLFPHHQNSNITIRTQLSAGATEPCYISLILYEQPSATITPENPVIGYQEQYYDDRILGLDFGGFMVLLSGTPGGDQTEAMGRLLERVEVLVRAGWTAGS